MFSSVAFFTKGSQRVKVPCYDLSYRLLDYHSYSGVCDRISTCKMTACTVNFAIPTSRKIAASGINAICQESNRKKKEFST